MKHEDLHDVVKEVFYQAFNTLTAKNAAYSSQDDALANFKEAARFQGLSDYQIWGTYFYKHVSAIFKSIRDNPDKPVDKSEGFRSKIIDSICYLAMLYAMDLEKGKGFDSLEYFLDESEEDNSYDYLRNETESSGFGILKGSFTEDFLGYIGDRIVDDCDCDVCMDKNEKVFEDIKSNISWCDLEQTRYNYGDNH